MLKVCVIKVCTVIAVDSWPVWGVMAGVMAFRMTGIAPAAAMAAAMVSWLALAAYIAMLAKTSQPTSFITAALRTHGCGCYRVRSLEKLNVVNELWSEKGQSVFKVWV